MILAFMFLCLASIIWLFGVIHADKMNYYEALFCLGIGRGALGFLRCYKNGSYLDVILGKTFSPPHFIIFFKFYFVVLLIFNNHVWLYFPSSLTNYLSLKPGCQFLSYTASPMIGHILDYTIPYYYLNIHILLLNILLFDYTHNILSYYYVRSCHSFVL